jgi:hypothetical protein
MAARWGNDGTKVAADEARGRDNLLLKIRMSAILLFPIGGIIRGTSRETIGQTREVLAPDFQAGRGGKRFFYFYPV